MTPAGGIAWTGRLNALAGSTPAMVALMAILAIGLAMTSVWLHGVPHPRVHDEFSHLLAADTFARGRVTNPTHPRWIHFETMHVLQKPTYQSMYPPGQGLLLAAGQWIRHPVLGVWLGIGLMAGALTWMLRGWLPGRWALAGGLLAVAQFVLLGREYGGGTLGYWSQTYWGGALAATGGALVFGAWPRIRRRARIRDVVWMGLGLLILAHTRPYEGLAASLPIGIVLAAWFIRTGAASGKKALRTGLPLLLMAGLILASLMAYNRRVTGDRFKMPFVAHQEQYGTFPVLLFQQPRAGIQWNHAVLEKFHGGWEMNLHARHETAGGLVRHTVRKLYRLWAFYLGPLLTIPFVLALVRLRRRRNVPLAAGTLAAALAAVLLCVRAAPHYLAPATAALVLLVALGFRELCFLRVRRHPFGKGLATVLLAACWLLALGTLARPNRGNREPSRFMSHRAELQAELETTDGRHLVLVSYGPRHSIHNEWVYNAADIDAAPVVWARDLGPDGNRELLDFFQDRTVWRLIVNDDSFRPQLMKAP